jgi:hypothetical protein
VPAAQECRHQPLPQRVAGPQPGHVPAQRPSLLIGYPERHDSQGRVIGVQPLHPREHVIRDQQPVIVQFDDRIDVAGLQQQAQAGVAPAGA